MAGKTEVATFAAGCFWGVEAAFRQIPEVVSTSVGYTGGATDDPTYEQVCSGTTGHAEAVRVEFDPERIAYQSPEQERAARDSVAELEAAERFPRPIVTEIVPAPDYWPAEDYHQQYFEKMGGRRHGRI